MFPSSRSPSSPSTATWSATPPRIKALKSSVADAGYRAVSLSVEPDNPARRIYERAGFVRCGTEGGSWTMIADL